MSRAWMPFLRCIAALCLVLLAGCAAGPSGSVTHQFIFNGVNDGWAHKVDLLAYSYGDQYRMVSRSVRPDEAALPVARNVNSTMPVGEFLHVRWRVIATDTVHERRVDLRKLLPRNMFEHAITFVIDDDQLYVYLVTPQPKRVDAPPLLRTTQSRYRVTYEIYPTNTYQNR